MDRTNNHDRVTALDIEMARRERVAAIGTDQEQAKFLILKALVDEANREWWEKHGGGKP